MYDFRYIHKIEFFIFNYVTNSMMFSEAFDNEIKVNSVLAEKLDKLIEIYKKKLSESLEKEI